MQLRTACTFIFFAFRNGNHYGNAFHPVVTTRTTPSYRLNHPSRARQNLLGNNYSFLEERRHIATKPYQAGTRSTSALN